VCKFKCDLGGVGAIQALERNCFIHKADEVHCSGMSVPTQNYV
jgi:hypothetical protein